MEASKKAPTMTNEQEKKGDTAFDAELWGNLQDHIPLEIVYEKLSPDDLFRLRLVCKVWNHGALQRLLPKPSFVPIIPGYCEFSYLNGIVTYDVVSSLFSFKRHRFPLIKVQDYPCFRGVRKKYHVQPFETEGLILCHNPNDCTQRDVFNVHTQTWHVIPPPPPPRCKSLSICGLMVDTSLKPYSFKLIEGDFDINTRIYDSKTWSWSTTSSRLLQTAEMFTFQSFQYSCICNNGHVYISSGRSMILKYSMEDDLWTTLKFPKVKWNEEDNAQLDNSLGVWEGRIFTTWYNSKKHRVTVWELIDSERQMWEEYTHTTKKQYGWLLNCACAFCNKGKCVYDEILRSFFRDGYLLVVMWRRVDRANALIMLNMATKKWQKVHLPRGIVPMEVQEPVSDDDLSESNDGSREDVADEVVNDDDEDSEDSEDE